MAERDDPTSGRRPSDPAAHPLTRAPSGPQPLDDEAVGDAVRRAAAAVGVPVVAAYLFGSRAEGRSHPESDIDLAVLVPPDRAAAPRDRFGLRVALVSALMAELQTNAVDVVLLNEAPPLLARRIVTRGRRIVCTNDAAERTFRRDAQLMAADLEPFLRRTRSVKLRALAR